MTNKGFTCLQRSLWNIFRDIFENFADNEEEAVEEEIEIRDILLIKVAQNQILNIFYQKKSF